MLLNNEKIPSVYPETLVRGDKEQVKRVLLKASDPYNGLKNKSATNINKTFSRANYVVRYMSLYASFSITNKIQSIERNF